MSKRLQVVLDDAEYRDLQKAARTRSLTVLKEIESGYLGGGGTG